MINYAAGDLIKTRVIDEGGIISFFEPSNNDKKNIYLVAVDEEFDVVHVNKTITCVEVYYDKCFYTIETINLERC
jgi:hypothetical protein